MAESTRIEQVFEKLAEIIAAQELEKLAQLFLVKSLELMSYSNVSMGRNMSTEQAKHYCLHVSSGSCKRTKRFGIGKQSVTRSTWTPPLTLAVVAAMFAADNCKCSRAVS